jgi:ATP-dependent protease ClpP protease subunit
LEEHVTHPYPQTPPSIFPYAVAPEAPQAHLQGDKLTVQRASNRIYFYDRVNSDRVLALMEQVRQADNELRTERNSRGIPDDYPATPIWLHIHSGGGDVFAGFNAADQLAGIESPVYSVVEGICASAATLISMACTKRYIRPNAFMLLHQFTTFFWGTYQEAKDDMVLNDMLIKKMIDFYVQKTKMDRKTVKATLKRDSWFDPKQCVENGIVDKVLMG